MCATIYMVYRKKVEAGEIKMVRFWEKIKGSELYKERAREMPMV